MPGAAVPRAVPGGDLLGQGLRHTGHGGQVLCGDEERPAGGDGRGAGPGEQRGQRGPRGRQHTGRGADQDRLGGPARGVRDRPQAVRRIGAHGHLDLPHPGVQQAPPTPSIIAESPASRSPG